MSKYSLAATRVNLAGDCGSGRIILKGVFHGKFLFVNKHDASKPTDDFSLYVSSDEDSFFFALYFSSYEQFMDGIVCLRRRLNRNTNNYQRLIDLEKRCEKVFMETFEVDQNDKN